MKLEDYLTVRQFAEVKGVTNQAVRKAISQGRIKTDIVGEYFVIHKSQLVKMKKKVRSLPKIAVVLGLLLLNLAL